MNALALHEAWPPHLESLLAGVPGDVGPAWYRQQWHCGRLAVLRWGPPLAPADVWLLVRIEAASADPAAARVLVVVAAIGEAAPPPGGHFPAVMPRLEDLAAAHGCGCLRIHTHRPGLVRRLVATGWQISRHPSETILTRELAPELVQVAA